MPLSFSTNTCEYSKEQHNLSHASPMRASWKSRTARCQRLLFSHALITALKTNSFLSWWNEVTRKGVIRVKHVQKNGLQKPPHLLWIASHLKIRNWLKSTWYSLKLDNFQESSNKHKTWCTSATLTKPTRPIVQQHGFLTTLWYWGAIWSNKWCTFLLNEELKSPRILKITWQLSIYFLQVVVHMQINNLLNIHLCHILGCFNICFKWTGDAVWHLQK